MGYFLYSSKKLHFYVYLFAEEGIISRKQQQISNNLKQK